MAAPRIPVEELCDARFLAALERLRIVARRVAPRGRFAEQRSRDRGSGLEFKDHRAYTSGDDLRTVDWNVYRRLGRMFLRLFEELEDLPLYLLVDVSQSAYFEDPPRARAGLRAALALAAISLSQHDPVGVYPFSDDLRVLVRPASGKSRVLGLAQRMAEIEPAGSTDLARSLATFSALRQREGLVVVVSDFFDPAGLEAVTEALGKLRHRLLLLRLKRAEDAEPTLQGDLRLVDCESGMGEDVSISSSVLTRYRAAYARFEEGLASFALARGAGLLTLDADAEVVPQLERLFAGGTWTA
ncbi:MAG: DUF58 domain-containing protein [Planctomycetota bacterium]|nr:DUF58 domain-containing protein [Planctomycetota bacterium]